jgi:hypothetical protein
MVDSVFLYKTSPLGMVEIWRKGLNDLYFHLIHDIKNLITNVGKAEFANIQIAAGTAPSHAAVGTGITAANILDTTLGTEKYRAAATRSRTTITVANDTAYYDTTINVDASWDITEAGLLNAASNGILFARQVFTAVSVSNGVVLKVVWKLQN